MKHIALTILLSGCTTVGYWEKNPNVPSFDDADIHFVQVRSDEQFENCDRHPQHVTACAVRCVFINPDHHRTVCRTGFNGLPDRWRCVIVSTYTWEQLELMRDRNGMPVIPHERLHCKGLDHGYN